MCRQEVLCRQQHSQILEFELVLGVQVSFPRWEVVSLFHLLVLLHHQPLRDRPVYVRKVDLVVVEVVGNLVLSHCSSFTLQ